MLTLSDISWTGIIAAALASFLLGGLWFTLLFGRAYARALGRAPDPKSRPAPLMIVGSALWGLITALPPPCLWRGLAPARCRRRWGSGFPWLRLSGRDHGQYRPQPEHPAPPPLRRHQRHLSSGRSAGDRGRGFCLSGRRMTDPDDTALSFADPAALTAGLRRMPRPATGSGSVSARALHRLGRLWAARAGMGLDRRGKRSAGATCRVRRLTPRRPRSGWSARNIRIAQGLMSQAAMQPAGLEQILRARRDGRWRG